MARLGVKEDRLELVGRLPWDQYAALYHRIDIGLDPFPYTGHTTTCDCLWMGVPVVTISGNTAVSRGGVCILSNVGLRELIAEDVEQYVALARKLAADLPGLAALRAGLRQRMQQSALMDAKGFARDMEAVYRWMWRAWCEG
jgi:predicted O-linked N-acetylglucosamine transferase (SPINDLY family)